MSIVGPRDIIPPELEQHYGHCKEKFLSVKPGLTGLWQVSGRSLLPYEERVRLDMYYIDNRSIWLDLKILLKTPWVVIKGDGAV
jgi:lipopolysaccharide/colanic/teichoic acid biosynthesis glycosyltransferase